MKSLIPANTKKILFYSESETYRSLFQAVLETLDVDPVIWCSTIEQAMVGANEERIDLFIAGWDQGLGNGGVFLQHIRKLHPYMDTRFILFSATFDAAKIHLGIEFQVTDFLCEPLDRKSVYERIVKALRGGDAPTVEDEMGQVLIPQLKQCLRFATYQKGLDLIQGYLNHARPVGIVLLYKGMFLEALGKNEAALAAAKSASAHDEVYVPAIHLLGKLYLKEGDYKHAILQFNQAKLLSPHHINRLLMIGESYYRDKKNKQAHSSFSQAYHLDPYSVEAVNGVAKTMIHGRLGGGLIGHIKQNYTGQTHLSLLNTTAVMLVKKKRFSEGEQIYRLLLEMAGSDQCYKSKIYFNLGLLYERMSKINRAKAAYEKAIACDSCFAKPHGRLKFIKETSEQKSSRSILTTPTVHSLRKLPVKPLLKLHDSKLYQTIIRICQEIGQETQLPKMLQIVGKTFIQLIPHEYVVILKTDRSVTPCQTTAILQKEMAGDLSPELDPETTRLMFKVMGNLRKVQFVMLDQQLVDKLNAQMTVIKKGQMLVNIPLLKTKDDLFHLLFVGTIPLEFEMPRKSVEFLLYHLQSAIFHALEVKKITQKLYMDELTGVANIKMLGISLKNALIRRKKEIKTGKIANPISLMFMDIDNFKRVNDTYGHVVGSKLLVETAKVLKSHARKADTVLRYGGDEYVMVFPSLSTQDTFGRAERIRKTMEQKKFLAEEGLALRLTVSIGIASYPDHAMNMRGLVECADAAMYRAKKDSKNAVFQASSSAQSQPATLKKTAGVVRTPVDDGDWSPFTFD